MKIAVFQLSLFGINTYVIYDPPTGCAAIIDPGMINEEEENAIDNFISRNNLKVTHIINTHLHIDHAIGNAHAVNAYKAPLHAHPDDFMLNDSMQTQAEMFGLPFRVNVADIDSPLHDGESIRIGEGTLQVIHMPGHSPGGVALYDKADGFLISGDSLFEGSVGRTDLPGGDMTALISAIKEKLLTLPDDTVVYPGHGGPPTIARERRTNPFLR